MLAALLCSSCAQESEELLLYDLDLDGKADFGYAPDPDFDYGQCPGGEPHLVSRFDGSTGPAAWTVMHFAAADSSLEDVLLQDIHEMEVGHNETENVNIVVQLDMRSADGMWRYQVRHALPDQRVEKPTREDLVSIELMHDEAEPDSGDYHAVIDFAHWAINCYPAERYGFIIGGHGGGWSSSARDGRSSHPSGLSLRARQAWRERGEDDPPITRTIAPDDTNRTEMFVDELAAALTEVRNLTVRCGETPNGRECENAALINRLAFYGSDACLMGDMGVVFDLRNTAMYIIGSEETEPLRGWPYNTFIRTLTAAPYVYAQRPHLLVEEAVEAYGRSFEPGGSADEDKSITLAAVDTAAVWQAVNSMEAMARAMAGLLKDGLLDPRLVTEARKKSLSFGDGYTDLGLFATRLRADLIEAGVMPAPGEHLGDRDERFRTLREAIDRLTLDLWDEFIVASVAGPDFVVDGRGAMGVSIFLPIDDCYRGGMSVEDFSESGFARASLWPDFLAALSSAEPLSFEKASGSGLIKPAEMTLGDQTYVFEQYIDCDYHTSTNLLSVHVDHAVNCVEVLGADGETRCVAPPSISFEFNDQEQSLRGFYMWSSRYNFDIDFEAYNSLTTPLEMEVSESATHYAGSFAIEFPRKDDSEERVRLKVIFECNDFEINEDSNCYGNYYDNWDYYDW